MKKAILQGVVSSFLLGVAPAIAQLPPVIMLDSYLLRAEQFVRDNEYAGALAAMERLVALQEEHDLTPSAEYHFRYARIWEVVGASDRALASAVRYLELEGRDAEHYVDALTLMNRATAATEAIEREREVRAAAETRARAERERALSAAPDVVTRMEFVDIPAGRFRMGYSDRRRFPTQSPRTQVRIARGFAIARYKVTQSQWEAIMGSNRSHFAGCPRCPVEDVSWEDVQRFISFLNRAGDSTWTYRLPTEAEWEYAARGGEGRERFVRDVDEYAWYGGNSDRRTHPVGLKRPNGFGLYDMLGNVRELVQDWFSDRYPGGSVVDPTGPAAPTGNVGFANPDRVTRGCYWMSRAEQCELFSRDGFDVGGGGNFGVGFRLVRTTP